ncbi:hypothetical protein MLD38_038300 [Melastoma candidum]|uniref:Uncharacterized protein n=1 Tax=Melastoma candidum TaxID=119954 RepID=A0ACB9KZN6_9MYRT|nr:hypothetical protein MLD38_038300 [Melastoma candidum]
MQRLVDNALAVSKESVKTISYESMQIVVRIINGLSALLLTLLPGKASMLEGMQGWELRPTFSGPRFPKWMEHGVSSFNEFIHDLSIDLDDSSSLDYSSAEDDLDEDTCHSPSSQGSRMSRASSYSRNRRHKTTWTALIISWLLIPVKLLLALLSYLFFFPFTRKQGPTAKSKAQMSPHVNSLKKIQTLRDQFIQRATDRRRGVIEDIQLGLEIFIEAIFDVFHKAAQYLFSPSDAINAIRGWFSPRNASCQDGGVMSDQSVAMSKLGENDPSLAEGSHSFSNTLNTDARTCRDVITELGYPHEAIKVATDDGYMLLLERIPRREARKAVFFQHGVLDSSMGWISNGVVGSPAFAAYDQGYDVYLGNFRGLVSREHVDKGISSMEYWKYSINEHGTMDVPAMIEKIHDIKTSELKLSSPGIEEECDDDQPYKLCAVTHSLGGAAMLMYVITCRMEGKPHRLSRLILLSPAGFHGDSTIVFTLVERTLLLLAPILAPLVPAFYIPTRFFRMLVNKLARDFHNNPAVGGLVQTLMGYVVGGDSSNWVGVLGLPHYNMNDMPGVSFNVALHLAQMKRTGRFRMFDYGSPSANTEIYGTPEPPDLGELYDLINIPVDLVAGRKDKVIRPSMVRKHYKLMKEAGVDVSYNEFEYAHLDFTFSHREELLAYVMSRLLLVSPSTNRRPGLRNLKSGRKERTRADHAR